MTKTLKAMSTWLRRRDVSPSYIFVAEYGGAYKPDSDANTGVHVHGLVHCPVGLLPAFMAFMTSIVGGGPRTVFFSQTRHPLPADPCQHLRTERQRGFALLYLCKGASDKALKMLTPPEWKTYTGGLQGTIVGKRSWISRSLGKEAQQRAGFQRLTKLHKIREALGPMLSETKKAGFNSRPSFLLHTEFRFDYLAHPKFLQFLSDRFVNHFDDTSSLGNWGIHVKGNFSVKRHDLTASQRQQRRLFIEAESETQEK